MNYASASSCRSVVRTAGFAVLFAWLAPAVPAAGVVVFLNGFESGMCTWSPVANPEVCDGIDNDCNTQIDEGGVCMICGDGFIIPGVEECDDENTDAGDGCSSICTEEHGFHCLGEPSLCSAVCGDGVVEPLSEQCDDTPPAESGDGCSIICTIEHAFYCSGEPSVCFSVCGDGLIEPLTEQCDDAPPAESGDGCSIICLIEGGWGCAGEPSVCVPN